ncbi:sigma-70 family RNA polymerase sigma factor [bacterium]|nr:sigma-70 family RNA polymerase sigma factor [bacterium]
MVTLLVPKVRQLPHEPDADLLARFADRGDETAFAELVRRHARLVWSVCRRHLRHEQDAEDAFQAAFLVLARRPTAVRRAESVGAFLHGVARRVSLKARQRDSGPARRPRAAPPTTDPPAAAAFAELQAALDAEVAALPAMYRGPFVLCVLDGRSRAEAAAELGLNEGTLSARLARARLVLRDRLAKRGVLLTAAMTTLDLARGSAAVPLGLVRSASGLGPRTPAVAALAAGFGRPAVWPLASLAAFGLFAGLLAAGVASAPPADHPPQPPPSDATPPRDVAADAATQPLPPGAAARLGAPDFRLAVHVHGVALSPDGRLVAGGSAGAPVTLWDRATGRVVRELAVPGARGGVPGLFTPDGRSILAVAYTPRSPEQETKTEAVLLDVQTGQLRWRGTADGPFIPYAFAPDGKTLAAGCRVPGNEDGVTGLGVFDAATAKLVRVALPDATPVAAGLSADGGAVTAVCRDGTARVLDPATGRERRRATDLFPDGATWTQTAVSPDGRLVAVGGPIRVEGGARPSPKDVPYTLRLLDTATGRPAPAPEVSGEFVAVAFGPGGKTLAASVAGRGLRVFDLAAGREVCRVRPDDRFARGVIAPDGRALAVWSNFEPVVQLYDPATGRQLVPPGGHTVPPRGVTFSPDGREVSTLGGLDGGAGVIRWDAATGRQLGLCVMDAGGRVGVGSDGRRLVREGPGGEVTVGGTDRDAAVETGYPGVLATAVSPDGSRVAVRGNNEAVGVWDAATGKKLWEQAGFRTGSPTQLAWSPDGRRLAVGWWTEVTVLDGATGRVDRRWAHGDRIINGVAWSPDGRWLAATRAGREEQLVALELATGQQRGGFARAEPIPSPEYDILFELAFAPDGRSVAVVCNEPVVRVIEWASGRERRQFRSHPVMPAAGFPGQGGAWFSPDGRRLAVGHEDATVLLWDVPGLDAGERRRADALTADAARALWGDLIAADPVKADSAARLLGARADLAVPLFRRELKPIPKADPVQLAKLIAGLGAERFADREAAERELAALGDAARPALVAALTRPAPAEVRRRLGPLLVRLDAATLSGERLRGVRGVEVLERVGSADARRLLRELAGGEPGRLTDEATAALGRLGRSR